LIAGPRVTSRRPTSTLVLCIMTGALAAVSLLPTAIPLTQKVADAVEISLKQNVTVAGLSLALLQKRGVPPEADWAEKMSLTGVAIRTTSPEETWTSGQVPTAALSTLRCDDFGQARMAQLEHHPWMTLCVSDADAHTEVWALRKPEPHSSASLAWLVGGLAAVVGISTALGVLQLMSPLSKVSRAIQRVGAGERGVRLETTGLTELDEIVQRLNDAARAMEDREDAILSRIQVVQQLARLVAHEIRNPLQALEFNTSLVATEPEAHERETIARDMHATIRELGAFVTRLLRNSEGGTLQITTRPTPMDDMVHHAIAFQRRAAAQVDVTLEPGDIQHVVAEIDRVLVTRAVENLVTNALQAVKHQEGLVRVSLRQNGGFVEVIVDDDGPGVDPDLSDTIFQRGITGREDGTGLGLSLVKGVATAHSGYVDHARSPYGGARFRIGLPIHRKEEQTHADLGG